MSVIGSSGPEGGFERLLVNAALFWRRTAAIVAQRMPSGLFARSLIIIIAPMVILQSVLVYAFMERHWQTVTRRLSAAVTQDIAALIEVLDSYPHDERYETLGRVADRMSLDVDMLPPEPLPPMPPRPLFSILEPTLAREMRRQVGRPFWFDTTAQSQVEIRIQTDRGVMRVLTRRSQVYASNSHIFLVWMLGSSLVLVTIAVVFMRNQVRPIARLAEAAESFGLGRDVEFRPRGATEVRRAGYAFLEMKRRIERAMDQRTAMLNGVSHDLRTILTRFKLSLELLEETPDSEALRKDVDEMSRMLEGYLAFARGDTNEPAGPVDMVDFLDDLRGDAERSGHSTTVRFEGDPVVIVRADAFKRCLSNLVSNAARYGDKIEITGTRDSRWLTVHVDDDGPGIPPERRDEVFKPFVRLDEARNVDEGGSGLGLSIARDVARSHGGDVILADSPMGGLRATVRIPV